MSILYALQCVLLAVSSLFVFMLCVFMAVMVYKIVKEVD